MEQNVCMLFIRQNHLYTCATGTKHVHALRASAINQISVLLIRSPETKDEKCVLSSASRRISSSLLSRRSDVNTKL